MTETSVERDLDRIEEPPVLAPPAMTTSIRYAALVPLLAIGTLAFFGIIGLLGSGSTPAVPVALTSFGATTPLRTSFTPVLTETPPPNDILGAVVLPAGTTTLGALATTGDPTSFDAGLRYRSSATAGFLQSFFLAQLRHAGWTIRSTGTTSQEGGGFELIAEKGGSDTFTWDLGIVIAPTRYSSTGGGAPTQSTDFSVRLEQIG